MSIEGLDVIAKRERTIRWRDRLYFAGLCIAVLIVLTALVIVF